MRIVVFGASGGVGRHVVTAAVRAGHEVVACARTAPTPDGAGVIPLAVDVRDADAATAALHGTEAVLWCVGVTRRSGGDVGRASLPPILAAAAQGAVRRWISVSGAGVTLDDDDKGLGARVISAVLARVGPELLADKVAEHRLLAATGLRWTELRPPRLVDRPGTGRYQLGTRAPGPTAAPVAKADVARAMVDLVADDEWVHRSPFVTSRR